MSASSASVNTTPNPKTATDSNGPKFGNAFIKIKRPWSHSVDTNHHFLRVKFEVRFIISFSSKPMPNEK
jgi:hypothetical protein